MVTVLAERYGVICYASAMDSDFKVVTRRGLTRRQASSRVLRALATDLAKRQP